MNLLQLDHLVFSDHLLPFLGVNDLLRLRRVCRDLKTIAEDFIETNKIKSGREMVTNFYERNNKHPMAKTTECLEKLTTGLPIRYRLRISSDDSEKDIRLQTGLAQLFYTNIGENITHLSIGQLGIPLGSKKMFRFFEQFPNIRHLVLDLVRPWKNWGQKTRHEKSREVEVPSNFSKLESFSVTNSYLHQHTSLRFIAKLVENCLENLKSLSLPFEQFLWHVEHDKVINLACLCLFSENSHLKISNLDGSFIELLLNPRTHLQVMRTRDAMVRAINEKVVSIRNPGIQSFALELPNLEKIHFASTYERYVMQPVELCTRWSTISEIIVSANVEYDDWEDDIPRGPYMPYVCEYLFGGDFCWERLSKLDLSLIDSAGNIRTYPDTRDIARSCMNLKSIAIRFWNRRHVDLAKLWEGLPLLEEVRFSHCTRMGNDAFFGESEEEPAFLKMKNLKILEIRNIEDMRITNSLFVKILRHMPLKELVLSTDIVVEKQDVVDWMFILHTGRFAESIERINIDDLDEYWGADEKYIQFKRKFRSFLMV